MIDFSTLNYTLIFRRAAIHGPWAVLSYVALYFAIGWLERVRPGLWRILSPALVIGGFAAWREPFDIAAGGPVEKSILDYSGWLMVALLAAVVIGRRLRKEKTWRQSFRR